MMVMNSNDVSTGLNDELDDHTNTTVDYIGSDQTSAPTSNALTQIAIGAIVGATIGGVATALSNPTIVNRINQTVRGVGFAVKKAANGVDDTVRDVGDAMQSVATGVNDTAREVSDAVRGTAEGISGTVKSTINTVQGTVGDVNDTIKSTANAVQSTTEEISALSQRDTMSQRNTNGAESTLYKLVPVNSDEPNP